MSEENNSEGYVVEGDLRVAVRGHLVLYSVTGGRIGYAEYAGRAQELGLGRSYVPSPRRPKDAFAIAKDVLQNMSLPTLDESEGWDSPVQRKVIVKPLKRGNEYAVMIEHTGRSRGRRHRTTSNLFRITFDPPENFDPDKWWEDYTASFWDDKVDRPAIESLRNCLSIETYWEDQDIDDPLLMVRLQTAVLNEFSDVATSVDDKMLRNDVRRILQNLGGLPFKSGSGAWFVPSRDEENSHLETLERYSSLLDYFGNTNALSGDPTRSSWYNDNGGTRRWYRQRSNLRVMGYIDNERQLGYIREDIQNTLCREVAEYHEKLLKVANGFNDEKIDEFEERLNGLDTQRSELQTRLENLTEIVGGNIEVSVDPFQDINEAFNSRLETIGEASSSVTVRLRNLMSLD